MKTTAFKMTELGPIPSDWEVKRLGEVFSLLRNNTYARESLTEEGGSVFNIHYGDVLIKFGAIVDFDRDSIPYLKPSVPSNKDTLQDGDLIFADTAEDETVGKACEVANLKGRKAVSGLHTILCRPSESLFASGYLGYYINSAAYHNQLLPLITGTKVSSISRGGLESTLIVLPPLPEQHRIAAALSDVDELIGALGKLVEKKRAIKTGAMQRLLTGQTRLPGFGGAEFKQTELGPIPSDWEVKRLGEVCEILDNRRVPLNDSQRKKGLYPYCGANGIVDYIDRYAFNETVILIAEDGGNFSDFATRPIAYQMSGKFWVNNHAHVLVTKENAFQSFVFCQLEHKDITDVISGGTRAKLTRGQLEGLLIVLPPTLPEQRAIAAVLSDMDAEIAALEAEQAKYTRIKSGMMQELLTGRTRLEHD